VSLLTPTVSKMLRANALMSAQHPRFDPYPLARLFNPRGTGTWLATELHEDADTLFGIADLGFGCPELACFSLWRIQSIHLPRGTRIERDRAFQTRHRLSTWIEASCLLGSIDAAQTYLRAIENRDRDALRTGSLLR